MRTAKPSCARTGSAGGREAGPWPAPPGDRPGRADPVPPYTPHGLSWGPPDGYRAHVRPFAGDSRPSAPPGWDRFLGRAHECPARGSGLARLSWFLLNNVWAPRTLVMGRSSSQPTNGLRYRDHLMGSDQGVEVAPVGF